MIKEFYGTKVHICECGSDIFIPAGHCTSTKLLFDNDLTLICAKCGAWHNAKTGEKVVKC